ncbi:MAG: hypothetical protein WBQ44_08830 [Rhodococcus sp. (in: high G+C Gram-positive bacteria)]
MTIRFHVSSALNRASIREHGLDYRKMGAARGIAGSYVAEQEGCFLACSPEERDWFIRMNNTGSPVDVWEISDVEDDELVVSPEGHHYRPGIIRPNRIRLIQHDIP